MRYIARWLHGVVLVAGLFLVSTVNATEPARLQGILPASATAPALVTLEPLYRPAPASALVHRTVYISSRGNNFEPRFQTARRGDRLIIRNDDPVLHNTHIANREVTLLNVATPEVRRVVEKNLPREGLFVVRCDLHPWMRAWIAVTDAAYFSFLREGNAFSFDGVPPGSYRLVIQSMSIPVLSQRVQLHSGKTLHVSFQGERMLNEHQD